MVKNEPSLKTVWALNKGGREKSPTKDIKLLCEQTKNVVVSGHFFPEDFILREN